MLFKNDSSAAYRDLALQADAKAEAAVLDRVRERHEAAAARWRSLAELREHTTEARALRVSAAKASREAAGESQ
jgi:hypothetical protein